MGNQIDIENVNTDDASLNFPVGENSNTTPTSDQLDPQSVADEVLRHRLTSVNADVLTHVALCKGHVAFRHDGKRLKTFLLKLADAKVLSHADAIANGEPKPDSFISKAKKVSEKSEVLLNPKISQYLRPGISVLYGVAKLHDDLGDGEDRIDRLTGILETCEAALSRKWLEAKRNELNGKPVKPSTKKTVANASLPTVVSPDIADGSDDLVQEVDEYDDDEVDNDETEEIDDADESAESAPSSAVSLEVTPASAVFWSVRGATSSLLKASNNPVSPRWLSELQSMEKNACLFVHGKLNALFAMAPVIAKCGFRQPSRVILLTDPSDGDATTVEAIAIYQRGTAKIDSKFKDRHDESPPIELATSALDGASGRWAYLFAQSEAEGWDCIFGDENH
jgi:hypothetical protein